MSHNFLQLLFKNPDSFDFDFGEVQQDINKIDDRQWFDELIQNLELKAKNGEILKFRIIDIREMGFITKTCGLYAYLPFSHMPWQYENIKYWHTVFPFIKNKSFYCKVYKIQKDPLSIYLYADFPQFKLVLQRLNFTYIGIILQKTNQELIIDFGYHYNWKFGSILGYINESHLEDKSFSEYSVGEVIFAKFFRMTQNGTLRLSQKSNLLDWILNIHQSLVGKITWLEVKIDEKSRKRNFYLLGKYPAEMFISSDYYTKSERNRLKEALSKTENGTILNCEVSSVDLNNMTLKVHWISSVDLGIVHDKGIIEKLNEALNQNRLNDKTIIKFKI